MKVKKLILFSLLVIAFAMVFSCMLVLGMTPNAQQVQAYTGSISGSGTAMNPLIVSNYSDLNEAFLDASIDYIRIDEFETNYNNISYLNDLYGLHYILLVPEGQTKHLIINTRVIILYDGFDINVTTGLLVDGNLTISGTGFFSTSFCSPYTCNVIDVTSSGTFTLDGSVTIDAKPIMQYNHNVSVQGIRSKGNITINGGILTGYINRIEPNYNCNYGLCALSGYVNINGGYFYCVNESNFNEKGYRIDSGCESGILVCQKPSENGGHNIEDMVRIKGGTFDGIQLSQIGNPQRTIEFIVPYGYKMYWSSSDTECSGFDLTTRCIRKEVYVAKSLMFISFNANGGSGYMAQAETSDRDYELPNCDFDAPATKTFVGWALNSADGEIYEPTKVLNLTDDITLYAVWENAELRSIYYTDGNAIGEFEYFLYDGTYFTVKKFSELSFPLPVGKMFTGWRVKINGQFQIVKPGDSLKVDGDNYSFVAQYVDYGTTYQIDFDKGDESVVGEYGPITVYENTYYSLPENPYTKAGYTFKCWLINGTREVLPYRTYRVTENINVTPVWYQPTALDVSYDGKLFINEKIDFTKLTINISFEGGIDPYIADPIQDVIYYIDTSQIDMQNYYFDTLESVSIDVKYVADESIYKTLYLQVVDSYSISFNANGGEGVKGDVKVEKDTNYTLPGNSYTAPANKFFTGWSFTSNGAVIEEALINVDSNKTLYAIWAPIPVIIDGQTPDFAGGDRYYHGSTWSNDFDLGLDYATIYTNTDPYTLNIDHGCDIESLVFNQDMTVYLEYYDDDYEPWTISSLTTNGHTITFTSDKANTVLAIITLNGNVADLVKGTNVAQINVGVSETYTVSFNANGGFGTMNPVGDVSGSYTIPACTFTAPANKQFKGWSLTSNGSVITSAAISVSENITLFAIWEDIPAVTYAVSFNANGGSGTMNPVQYAGTYTLPQCTFTAPTDKQFKGWALSANGSVIIGTTTNISTDTTLYAIWEDIPAQDPEPQNPDPEQGGSGENGNNGNNNSNSNSENSISDNAKKPLSGGAIAGIVIACVVVLAGVGVGVLFLLKKKGIIGKK